MFQTRYLYKFPQRNEADYLWYKLCVYYHAKTELFDRELTDLRSPYDPTEAYLDSINMKISNAHAMKTREFIQKVGNEFGLFNRRFNDFNHLRLSAQGWIDEYNRLVDAGEMDFINQYLRYFNSQSNFTEEEKLSRRKMLEENSKPIGINIFDL